MAKIQADINKTKWLETEAVKCYWLMSWLHCILDWPFSCCIACLGYATKIFFINILAKKWWFQIGSPRPKWGDSELLDIFLFPSIASPILSFKRFSMVFHLSCDIHCQATFATVHAAFVEYKDVQATVNANRGPTSTDGLLTDVVSIFVAQICLILHIAAISCPKQIQHLSPHCWQVLDWCRLPPGQSRMPFIFDGRWWYCNGREVDQPRDNSKLLVSQWQLMILITPSLHFRHIARWSCFQSQFRNGLKQLALQKHSRSAKLSRKPCQRSWQALRTPLLPSWKMQWSNAGCSASWTTRCCRREFLSRPGLRGQDRQRLGKMSCGIEATTS